MRTGKAPREPKMSSNQCDSEKPIDFRFMDGIRSHYQKFKDILPHEPESIPETQLPMVALETYSHRLQIQEYASNSRDWKISDLDDSDGTPIFECAWAECKVKLKLGPGSKRAYSDHIFQEHGIIVSGGVCPFDECAHKAFSNLKTHLLGHHQGMAFVCPFYSDCEQMITGDKSRLRDHLNQKHREERRRVLSINITFVPDKVYRRRGNEAGEGGGTPRFFKLRW
ncbi:hypothetical protein NLI96_g6771 [Meripilus lineatus]|uniref:Uncharacterized protein n=1 Tax=Meripilus lineatus TaxID=2056292 RepID=A0AAD5YHT3_9APHY|nr:hypothetical protein NLI96_g6771 [Physisporinus lineatus]